MRQGPTPFLRATAQLDGPGTPCHRLTARVDRKRAAPRTEVTMHQARMPPRYTIAIVHEQGGTRRQSHGSRQRQRGRNPRHRSEHTSAPCLHSRRRLHLLPQGGDRENVDVMGGVVAAEGRRRGDLRDHGGQGSVRSLTAGGDRRPGRACVSIAKNAHRKGESLLTEL